MNLLLLPARNIALTIPVVLVTGFITGLYVDTSPLKNYILPVTMVMIYPMMIGFRLGEIINLAHKKLILVSLGINFFIVPLLAYLLGVLFLVDDPQLFAGLAIASLLPTSNMTIAFTMLGGGNIPAAIKLTVISLVLGSLLAPWYLLVMVGTYIQIDVLATLKTITLVVFVPLTLGMVTYRLILKKYTQEEFYTVIKPNLPAVTVWGMVYIIFTGMSTNAHTIVSQSNLFLLAVLVQALFYAANYFISLTFGRFYFNGENTITLVFSTVLCNLAISMGVAATAFGVKAALMVSLAFLFQGQSAAWFIRLNKRYNLLQNILPGDS
ncbi:MAG TPA: bile acid:sodium symporter [Bacillota bacterium]|nr:bile acid:sodium symporter [Bacillota bacterium]HQD77170.1 bile acid:sodium symporter [Bacillota bacterium]HUM59635.1 bile acid:sodium symporter [Bacillota bacterium]